MINLLLKEIKDFFKSKTILIYFILLFAIVSYGFYSAIDLYSKASVAAFNNPLYAAGFEPVIGVFVPTFGGFFIILSLILPFLLIQSINNEKRYNTIPLIAQFPRSLCSVFSIKILSAIMIILVSILFITPILLFWHLFGGHIPWEEILLMIFGYFLYALFVLAVSFFSASIFQTSSQASIFTLSFIMLSWFIDFGKEMNISPIIKKFSSWTITTQLKYFEEGILSFQSILYFCLLFSFFTLLAYLFFDFSIKNRIKKVLIIILVHSVIFYFISTLETKYDITESKRNSFSIAKNLFIKKLPQIKIKIYLEPSDSRYKDYENDFLKKLKLVKTDIKIFFAKGKELKNNYGIFKYTINNKTMKTYSNSEEEIFMILKDLSGLKIKNGETKQNFKGYPLIVKNRQSTKFIIIYLLLFPLMIFSIYYKLNFLYGRRKNEKIS
jgi:ABC-type transport system involved in multi-copper enzyme maturation permease subunit